MATAGTLLFGVLRSLLFRVIVELSVIRTRNDARDRSHLVICGEVDQFDSLRDSPRGADFVNLHPNGLSVGGHDEEAIIFGHNFSTYDLARLICTVHGEDAAPSASLDAILFEMGALSVAILAYDQQRTLLIDDPGADHKVVWLGFLELDSLDSASRS